MNAHCPLCGFAMRDEFECINPSCENSREAQAERYAARTRRLKSSLAYWLKARGVSTDEDD